MPNQPPVLFPTKRFATAVAVLVVGAVLSQLGATKGEQAAIFFSIGLIALIFMVDLRSPPARNAQATAPIQNTEPSGIANHPEFEQLINGLADPLLVISNLNVKKTNVAARKLLGNHIDGEDIRLVIRHPAAADRLTQPYNHDPDNHGDASAIQLAGIGSRDQRWEMIVRNLSSTERIIYLLDRSGSHAVEKMRTDFVANASHELRTPLASIKGFIETLEDDDAGGDPALRKRFLGVMFRETNRMQKLIDELISLSRIEADKFRIPEEPVDLAELFEDVQAVFQQSHGARGKDIVLQISPNLPIVNGDKPQLSQVLYNLVSNSVKYGRENTPITLSLRPSRLQNMVRISVEDEGDGIAMQHLPRLTERFYRVDASRSRAIGGTGLGLSIVKHIVERHRGRFEIDSVEGQGTTMTITLPAATPSADRPLAPPPPPLPVEAMTPTTAATTATPHKARQAGPDTDIITGADNSINQDKI